MSAASKVFKQAGVLAVLVVIGAVWMASQRAPQESALSGEPAVPGLKQRLAEVDTISIRKAGNELVATLRRQDQQWTLEEREFPADSAALRTLMLNLVEARRVEQKTANPELYDRLGVEEVTGADARGVQLLIEGGGDPIELIIGDNTTRGDGTYLRVSGDPASWQVDRNIAVDKSTANWLQRDLTDIDPNRVAQASVRRGDEVVEVRAAAAEDGDHELVNLPKGREPASEYVADALAGFLQGLRFEDLANDRQPPSEGVWQSKFALEDGLRFDVTSWEVDSKVWSSWTVQFDEAAAEAAILAEQTAEKTRWEASQAAAPEAETAPSTNGQGGEGQTAAAEAAAADAPPADAAAGTVASSPDSEGPLAVRDPAAHRAERMEALNKEFKQLQERFNGRAFQLPTHKSANLHRKPEDYMKPKA